MLQSRLVKRTGLTVGVAILFVALQGCTFVKQRGEDILRVGDIGVTVSKDPYLSLYACGFGVVGFGAGKCDGHFLGIGGDSAGYLRHYHRNLGLMLWTCSEVGWGDEFDPQKPETLQQWYGGPFGWMEYPDRRPAYGVACVHYFHFGWVGFAFNLRYAQLLDLFMFGTYDLCGDDGKKFGEGDWPWWADAPREGPVYDLDLPF